MPDTERAIPTLRASHERLRSLTEGLSDAELGAMSFCRDWTIAQVLSHLGSQSEIMGTVLAAALAGDPEPGNDSFPAIWERWNAMTPEQQRTDGLASSDASVRAIEAVEEPALSDVTVTLFGGFLVTDVPGFAKFRLAEHAVHTWDVAVALDPTAVIDPAAAALLLTGLPRLAARLAKSETTSLRLRVQVTDPAGDWLLSIGDDPGLEPWADQGADATVRLTGDQLIRLLYGRVTPADAIEVTGGSSLAQLQELFPGF